MMERYIIKCVGLAGVVCVFEDPASDAYLRAYDPEFMDGQGAAVWTRHVREAMEFASVVDAAALWQTIPRKRPTRSDGKPNRPLTAFTIEILKVETQ